MKVSEIQEVGHALEQEISKAIIGKPDTIRHAVTALLCRGHLLIEDIPGVGKTTLAKAIAKSIGGDFRRVQFTPDLLPSDVTGGSIFNQRTGEFEFRPGPVFSNVVLVDEINRATPKTQSALLEAMEEQQVSSDGETRNLPDPFFVLATQNNIEMTGTYPLPEAQLDRFFARVSLGYPDRETESTILSEQQTHRPLDDVQEAVPIPRLLEAQRGIKDVFVHDTMKSYIVDVVRATRENSLLMLGSSPRGSLYLMLAAQAHAAMDGSDYVRADDVKIMAPIVMGHRVMLRGEVRAQGTSGDDVIRQVLQAVPAPVPVG